ncbi:Outer membrane usher protein fimD precursor [Raoultella ornithinolytica]|nr:Outer membrane usher protein fimD precursor [Raoultella ornithinolytica]
MARCHIVLISIIPFSRGYANAGQGSNSSAALDYHGGYGSAQLGYRHDRVSHQLTWGAAGSLVAHPYGVTLGQPVGDSFAIVRAPGAANVAIQNGSNIHTDGRGYAVVPTLTVYRKNTLTLDTESMTNDTDVDLQGQTVIPGGGAIVLANYRTHIGNRVLFTLHDRNGAIPFGASVHLHPRRGRHRGGSGKAWWPIAARCTSVGYRKEGTLDADWVDNNISRKCSLHFHLSDRQQQNVVKTAAGLCL